MRSNSSHIVKLCVFSERSGPASMVRASALLFKGFFKFDFLSFIATVIIFYFVLLLLLSSNLFFSYYYYYYYFYYYYYYYYYYYIIIIIIKFLCYTRFCKCLNFRVSI